MKPAPPLDAFAFSIFTSVCAIKPYCQAAWEALLFPADALYCVQYDAYYLLGVNAAFRMKTVSTLTLLPLLFCLLPLPSLCTEEGILEPHEVIIRADAGAPYGEVRVTVRTKGIHSERRISDIPLEVGSTSVRIPEKAYQPVPDGSKLVG